MSQPPRPPLVRLAVLGFLVAAAPAVAVVRAQSAPADSPQFESYLAHVAAAEGALRHGDVGAVRRWLDAVAPADRAFEWRWLDAEVDQSIRTIRPDHEGALCIATSPDGSRFATGGADGRVEIWNAASFEVEVTCLGHEGGVFCVAWSADGARVASSAADATARVWDASTGEEITVFRGHAYAVTSVRFSPDGARMASTSYQRPKGGEIRIWSGETGEEIAILQDGYAPITCVHWNPAGDKVVSASWDQHLRVFDLANPDEPIVTRLGPEPSYRAAQAAALSPDGELVAVACKDNAIHLFEAWSGIPVRDFEGHTKWAEGVEFSPDGRWLASTSTDASVALWDVATGQRVAELRGHRRGTRGVAFSRDGRALLSTSSDGTIRQWDVAGAIADGHRLEYDVTAYHASESPDGTMVAVGFADGDLRLFSAADGRELRRLSDHGDWINRLEFTADGARLMSAGADRVALWDLRTGEMELALDDAKGVDGAALAPDGRSVVAVSRDAKLRGWDASDGSLSFELAFERAQVDVAFAPDGAAFATAGSSGAKLHDPRAGTVRVELAGHRGRVRAVAFHPAGELVATGGEDGTVRFWRVADGGLIDTFTAHDAGVRCLAFSPDGSRVATGGGDDRLRLFDVATRQNVLTLDVDDIYSLAWNGDGTRLWVTPLAKHGFCLDARPRRDRPGVPHGTSDGSR